VNRVLAALLVALLPLAAAAAISLPPPANYRDPSHKSVLPLSDESLPYVYLEPHDFCFNAAGPLRVTLSVVNRSHKAMAVEWRHVIGGVVLESIGPGRTTPARRTPAPPAAVELAPAGLVQITIDLRDWFAVEGASVYELSYARPLPDGRIHIGEGARFVVEDDAAIDKLAAALDAGPVRDTVLALLKDNTVFAVGGGHKKMDGWDWSFGRARPVMPGGTWDKPLDAAKKAWAKEIERLTSKDAPAGSARAVAAIIDRLLFLSDDLRADPGTDHTRSISGWVMSLPPNDSERLHLRLLRSRSPSVVKWNIGLLGVRAFDAALAELFRIGDGPNRELASEALSELSNYDPDPRIAAYLRRKMTDDDPAVALHAAIISCYSGDASGGGVVVRCMSSDDPKLRMEAIAQVVDEKRFRPHRDAIVRALLAELKAPTSDAHLERAIESLGSYPTDEVMKAVTPFVTHKHKLVAGRAQMTVSAIRREMDRK